MFSKPAWGLSALLVIPSLVSATSFDCSNFVVGGHKYNLEKLAGPHTLHLIQDEPPSISDFAFTLDICKNLPNQKSQGDMQCPTGTRICGTETMNNTITGDHMITKIVPIAGNYEASHGRGLDPKYARLKGSSAHSDSERDGVRVELGGGRFPDTRKGMVQKAIIEFECDPERTGLEGVDELEMEKRWSLVRRQDGEDGDDDDLEVPNNSSLQLLSYKVEEPEKTEMQILRLAWRTKYACEASDGTDETDGDKAKASWGWFTWLIIIVFLGVGAYLIFGSWLNYSRYGARGWDLLPHGDSIRDLPYIVKDWGRSVTGIVQGGSTRGGYSAV